MIPASQASRRAAPGLRCFAGVEVRGLQSAEEGVEGHQDHDGGVEAAGLRERLGGVAVDELGERLAEPLGGRLPLAERSLWLARCLGAANASRTFLSVAPVRVSRVNRPWTLPWPSSYMVSRVAACGVRVPPFEELGLVGVGGSGATTSRIRRPRTLQGCASCSCGLVDQVRLGLGDQLGVEVVGELVEGAEDDLGLVDPEAGRPPARPGSGRGPRRPWARPHHPVRGRSGGPGAVGVPVRGRGGAASVAATSIRSAWASSRPRARRAGRLVDGVCRWLRWSRRRPSTRPGRRPPRQLIAGTSDAGGDRVRAGSRSLSWDTVKHRPPTLLLGRESLVDNRFRRPWCGQKWTFERLQRRLRGSRHSRPTGGQWVPLDRPHGPQPGRGGNPIASPPLALAGAVNPPTGDRSEDARGLTAPARVRHSAIGLPPTPPSQEC